MKTPKPGNRDNAILASKGMTQPEYLKHSEKIPVSYYDCTEVVTVAKTSGIA